jgi:NhaA family Na+:H+ antiporter
VADGKNGTGQPSPEERPNESGSVGLRLPWSGSDRAVPRLVLRPLQVFLETEYAGGLLLLGATSVALMWANSPWGETYDRFWHTTLQVRLGSLSLSEDLRGWVNDALMVFFFFVVGLEIKRELLTGELRDRRAAALPVIAALGGMVGPALIYVAFNSGEQVRGWAIPMATDIAFALGVLSLVGPRIPSSLRAFLLALAIVDDIGAIVVIALFYSVDISWPALGVAGGLLLVIVAFQRLQVRWTLVYVALGLVVWLATLQSGVHATIAGVALGLLTPAEPFQRPKAVSEAAHRIAEDTLDDPFPPDADAPHWLRLGQLSREAVSPLARMQYLLHPWTSFVVIPVFALANAGLSLNATAISAAFSSTVTVAVIAGLVIGKPLGITLAAWLGSRAGIARLPEGVDWFRLAGVGALAGIGFTVSLFIADLAFASERLRDAARMGILAASVLAAGIGALMLGLAERRAGTARAEGAGDPGPET